MPTATEFDAAAARLEAAADDVMRVPPPLRAQFDVGVLFGGTLTPSVAAAVETDEATCAAAAATIQDHAAECRRRAVVVREYAADMAAYWSAVDRFERDSIRWNGDRARHLEDPERYRPPGRRPVAPWRPSRPADWVELG